jgi:plastocyanin
MRPFLAFALWLMTPVCAFAGDLAVVVRTPQGAPVADAVVSVAAPHSGPIRFPWPYRVAQHNLQFDPFVLVVPVGADVAFPNLDNVRHHVYSFSPAKSFELKLYGRDETRVVHFDKSGVVQLGCNIHDDMVAFIDVVETPYAAKTDAQGRAVLHDVPAGRHALNVWQPYLRAPGHAVSQSVQVAADAPARLTVVVDVHAPPMQHDMY